jgi:membrane protein YdbS with pleckstrin-like domain
MAAHTAVSSAAAGPGEIAPGPLAGAESIACRPPPSGAIRPPTGANIVSYVDENLLTGEQVMFRTRLHWNVYVAPGLLSLLVFVPLTWLAYESQRPVVAVAPLAAIAVALLSAFLRRRSSEFAVTNKRVVMKTGVFQTRSAEMQLTKVESVAVNQGLTGKVLGYGDIEVTGSGGTRERFSDIGKPLEFRRALQTATGA